MYQLEYLCSFIVLLLKIILLWKGIFPLLLSQPGVSVSAQC